MAMPMPMAALQPGRARLAGLLGAAAIAGFLAGSSSAPAATAIACVEATNRIYDNAPVRKNPLAINRVSSTSFFFRPEFYLARVLRAGHGDMGW